MAIKSISRDIMTSGKQGCRWSRREFVKQAARITRRHDDKVAAKEGE